MPLHLYKGQCCLATNSGIMYSCTSLLSTGICMDSQIKACLPDPYQTISLSLIVPAFAPFNDNHLWLQPFP